MVLKTCTAPTVYGTNVLALEEEGRQGEFLGRILWPRQESIEGRNKRREHFPTVADALLSAEIRY